MKKYLSKIQSNDHLIILPFRIHDVISDIDFTSQFKHGPIPNASILIREGYGNRWLALDLLFFNGEATFPGSIIFPDSDKKVVRTEQTDEEHGPVYDFPFILSQLVQEDL